MANQTIPRIAGWAVSTVAFALASPGALAAPLAGGTLVPTSIPKYVVPLVIPPAMPKSPAGSAYNRGVVTRYNIAQRQFRQQILPGGVWNTVNGRADAFPATPIWSYGRADDPIPPGGIAPAPAASSSFNYPAFTIESTSGTPVNVRWINELVAINPATGRPYPPDHPQRTFLPHVVAGSVDRSLHWANPERLPCMDGSVRTDCRPDPSNPLLALPYSGPVPMIPHVHGAHVGPASDGYPEAWWLPDADNIPADYARTGLQFDQALVANTLPGSAAFRYPNDQPATTIWYHDHSLGMTRNNVYAGPAGFWLIRGGANDASPGVLPGSGAGGRPTDPTAGGCDPNFDAVCRAAIREIPIAIQDRSFNADGTLFYPQTRDFFNLVRPNAVIPYVPSDPATCAATRSCSDVAPIWNPEFFGNTMVVNGTTWPKLEVAPQRYRLRLLNGSNARFINLALYTVPPSCTRKGVCTPNSKALTLNSNQLIGNPMYPELPIYQIGAEQGFLPKVVKISTGFATPLPGNGSIPAATPAANPAQALLMSPAERADVIVDFSGLPVGTVVRMVNTGSDAPFGGFPAAPLADKNTTGQVMAFVVVAAAGTDTSTPVARLYLPAEAPLGAASDTPRTVTLNEEASQQICVKANALTGKIKKVVLTLPTAALPGTIDAICGTLGAVPFAPKEALLGTLPAGAPSPQLWADPIAQNPALGATEDWEIYNYTIDAHPVHLHLVRFQVKDRQPLVIDPLTGMPAIPAQRDPALPARPAEPTEMGYKDTVTAYPGEVVRVRATFDIAGLYVWHCHIVEHEDNEMMVPFCVGGTAGKCPAPVPVPIAPGA